jgi:hypothetical protein
MQVMVIKRDMALFENRGEVTEVFEGLVAEYQDGHVPLPIV